MDGVWAVVDIKVLLYIPYSTCNQNWFTVKADFPYYTKYYTLSDINYNGMHAI